MSKRAYFFCTAIGVAALAVGVSTAIPSIAQAATRTVSHATTSARVNTTAKVNTTVRTNTRVNTGHTTAVKTTTTTTQFRRLNTSTATTGNPKFHKTTFSGSAHITPNTTNTLKVNTAIKGTPNLHVTPAVKLNTVKINPAVLNLKQQNNLKFIKLGNNHIAPVWLGPKKIWWGGKWKVFVPFTAIGAVLIGGGYYYPDAYVGFARPYCSGLTPDGCHLNWQQVNFEDGGADWQCVQFCPRPGAMPPPRAVALVAPPPVPQGTCEVTIFADPSFAGTGVTTGEEQPALSQSGWQNQIASIQVKSGTWDFFTDENFTGQNMRLQPGPYQDLGPEWTKKIGSFMCVQPGQ